MSAKTFDPNDYKVDTANRQDADAVVKDGALLYRVASLLHSERQYILTGEGALLSEGRYHDNNPLDPELTSYCANNVTLCLSEALFRLYRRLLDSVQQEHDATHLSGHTVRERCLVIFAVDQIDDLVYVDSTGARNHYYQKLNGPTITTPDLVYTPLQNFAKAVRKQGKNGVVYPSARHSEDLAFAFFEDRSGHVRHDPYVVLNLKLQLVSEEQDFSAKPSAVIDFKVEKLHHTIGYYEFTEPKTFDNLKAQGLLNPSTLPVRGYIDFVRRRYNVAGSHPDKKVMHCL